MLIMIFTIVYENSARTRPAIEYMIIFLADVAVSSFPYAVKYRIPLTTNITNANPPTKLMIAIVQFARIVSTNHFITPPGSCCLASPAPGRDGISGVTSFAEARFIPMIRFMVTILNNVVMIFFIILL